MSRCLFTACNSKAYCIVISTKRFNSFGILVLPLAAYVGRKLTSTVVSPVCSSYTWRISLTASPNFSFNTRSIPIVMVVVELGQLPQAPVYPLNISKVSVDVNGTVMFVANRNWNHKNQLLVFSQNKQILLWRKHGKQRLPSYMPCCIAEARVVHIKSRTGTLQYTFQPGQTMSWNYNCPSDINWVLHLGSQLIFLNTCFRNSPFNGFPIAATPKLLRNGSLFIPKLW